MRRIQLIGIGAGDPGYLTIQAVSALKELDVLFIITKEADTQELVSFRRELVARHRPAASYREVELADPPRPWRQASDYPAAVERWRAERSIAWGKAILEHLDDGESGAFLVWGDPSLYESTLTVIAQIAAGRQGELEFDVIPGISSAQALTARHRIALNRVGRAVQITPARLLAAGLPDGVDDVLVMLDAQATFARLAPQGIYIYWGAYLGTPDELLISGPLAEVADEIVRVRDEARARKGWIFDIYLLRRT